MKGEYEMKKLLAALLVAVLAVGAACACAEDDLLKDFVPQMTNYGQLSAEEWFSTEESRAMLTLFLTLDYSLEKNDPSLIMAMEGQSYVTLAQSGTGLQVLYYHDGTAYWVTYHPQEGTAQCLGPMDYTEEDVERVLISMQIIGFEYCANSDEAMIRVLQAMNEMRGEN